MVWKRGNSVWAGDSIDYLAWSGALDIVTHELTHGVTETTAGLYYSFQSGALNEHYSDFFGAMSDPDDWTICEDIKITPPGFLRNMADPHQGAVPDLFPFGYQPAHMDEFVDWPANWDNGAVHFNSGIPNKASYLVATAIGHYAAEEIWYRTLTTYLTPSSGFSFWGNMTVQSAVDLYGSSSSEAAAVVDALDSVGIVSTYVIPAEITMSLSVGTALDTNVVISIGSLDTVIILSGSAVLGNVSVTGVFPDTLTGSDQGSVIISYDATSLELCDLATIPDTVVITTSDPDLPEIIIPVTIVIGGEYSLLDNGGAWSTCNPSFSSMTMFNTTLIDRYMIDDIEGLYCASLMIGMIDGVDTNVYRHLIYTAGPENNGFVPVGFVNDSTNYYRTGYTSTYVDIATSDAKVLGKLQYYYDSSPDHCGQVIVEYKLYNQCDTPLTIVTGIFADFDAENDYLTNRTGINTERDMIYVVSNNGGRALAIASLSGTPRNMRTIGNEGIIWYDGFPLDTNYFEMMTTSNTTNDSAADWSVMLTFDTTTLGPGDTAFYRAAMLYSNSGVAGLVPILDGIGTFADTAIILLSDDFKIKQGITNTLYSDDTILVINYVEGFPGTKTVPWTALHNSSWMQLSSYSGMADDTVSVSYDLTGLEAGIYFDTINVFSDSALNSPQQMVIELRVNPGTGAVHVPMTYLPTIQSGADVAFDGDSVIVGPGTYVETISVVGKVLKFVSQNGPAVTTLSSPIFNSPIIQLKDVTTAGSEISGFTFTGSTRRSSLQFLTSVSPVIKNNVFQQVSNSYTSTHAILFCSGSDLIIRNNLFLNNSACCIMTLNGGSATIEFNTMIGNYAGVRSGSVQGSLTNNIIMNSTQFGVSGIITANDCNDIWNNAGGDYVNGAVAGPNDLSEDPDFCYTLALDFRLAPWSVCAPDNNSCNELMGAFEVGDCDVLCNIRGDVDHTGSLDIADLTYYVAYLFTGGPQPISYEEGDINGDGEHNISDLTFLVGFLFQGGDAAPPCTKKTLFKATRQLR